MEIRDWLLVDRLVLHNDVSEAFIQNMRMRLDWGLDKMDLSSVSIEPIFCSTINKHTCMEMRESCPEKYFLILDQHHFELLGSLDILYYMFGQNDIKKTFLRLAMAGAKRPHNKRMNATVALLLSEKSLLNGNATRATAFLEVYNQNKITTEDFEGRTGEFDFNWLLLNVPRLKIAQGLIMNYYVTHELAHIKHHCDKEILVIYKSALKSILASMPHDFQFDCFVKSLPENEIACDAYALDLLFDFMYEQDDDYYFEYMVDSFISAVSNLAIMDSVIDHGANVEDWYITCWFRVITALNVVGFLKDRQNGSSYFSSHIQECLIYGHMKFSNYKEEVKRVLDNLIGIYENVSEKHLAGSSEWKNETKSVCEYLASIK